MDALLVTLDAGGNVPPFLAVGRELCRRGHRARVLGPLSIRTAVENTGMSFRPLEQGAGFDPLARLSGEDVRAGLLRVFLDEGYGRDVAAEVARERPDLALIDCLLVGAQAATEALRVPYALLLHTMPGFLKDRFATSDLNAVRARLGRPPITSNVDLWALADRALVASTALLDDIDCATPPGLRYVGPIFEPAAVGEEPVPPDLPLSAHSVVLVAFSTTYMEQERTLSNVIDAIRDLPLQALLTAGPALDVASLPPAANVSVRSWIPHGAVLPKAALVVTHAGHGTVASALSHGVPLLCLPLGRDQGFIARRVQELGAGISLSPEATVEELRSAVQALLGDGRFRRGAQQVAAAIRAGGSGAANAVAELESILASR